MFKTLAIAIVLLGAMNGRFVYADLDMEQIRQDCEADVQAYGYIAPAEYERAVNDCIRTLMDPEGDELPYGRVNPDAAE